MDYIFKELEKEYQNIDQRWLHIHFKMTAVITSFIFLFELVIGKVMYDTGQINATMGIYLLKFLIIPSMINIIIVLIEGYILKSDKISLEIKIYTISLLFVILCFNVFTVHGGFSALFYIFTTPIVLTAIYSKYLLTISTSILSVTSFVISEIFIKWDMDKIGVFENSLTMSNFIIAIFIIITFSGISLVIIYFERAKNNAWIKKDFERHHLKYKVNIDELTTLFNRVSLREALDDLNEDTQGNNYAFVMIDLDNLKLLNDQHGHIVGDNCLISLGKIMKEECGETKVFRYGGDEFSIIFKNYPLGKVLTICRSIQKEFSRISREYKIDSPLTLSIGVAEYDGVSSPTELIKNSDLALYESKKEKDKITVYTA